MGRMGVLWERGTAVMEGCLNRDGPVWRMG